VFEAQGVAHLVQQFLGTLGGRWFLGSWS
jgi:hypothetical protein